MLCGQVSCSQGEDLVNLGSHWVSRVCLLGNGSGGLSWDVWVPDVATTKNRELGGSRVGRTVWGVMSLRS